MWGWEPREFTVYRYEGGVLVGTVTTREPEFNDQQRALLVAYERAEADRGSHGHPMSEATSPDADPAKAGGWRYEANEKPKMDFAARALADRQDAFYKSRPAGESRTGHLWYVQRVED